MNRTLLTSIVLALSFLGIADAWYLAQAAVSDTALTCSIAGLDGCNVVAQSPYARLFGIPLGVYGVGFYGVLFALAAALFVVSHRLLFKSIFVLGAIGAGASLIFVFIQLVVIKALCVYCIASAAIALLIFGSAWLLWKKYAPPFLVAVT